MYAVVEYNDYRKEQSFDVTMTTDDVEYAKKVAFQYAMNDIKHVSRYANDYIYRITTEVENEYLRPINKTIISYKVIEVEKYKKGFKPTKNLIRPADSQSSLSMTDKEINPSPEGADLNLQRFKIKSSFSTTYAVIEIKKEIDIENIQEIDTSLICDKYYNYDGEGYYDEDDEQ